MSNKHRLLTTEEYFLRCQKTVKFNNFMTKKKDDCEVCVTSWLFSSSVSI